MSSLHLRHFVYFVFAEAGMSNKPEQTVVLQDISRSTVADFQSFIHYFAHSTEYLTFTLNLFED